MLLGKFSMFFSPDIEQITSSLVTLSLLVRLYSFLIRLFFFYLKPSSKIVQNLPLTTTTTTTCANSFEREVELIEVQQRQGRQFGVAIFGRTTTVRLTKRPI